MLTRLLVVVAALALSACASAPGPSAPIAAGGAHARPVAPSARAHGDPTNALLRAGATDAITTAQARAMFGPPDVERRDGAGALLVWTLPSCALTLGFANDRLRTVEPGPRRTGEMAPTLQACVTEARARAATS